MSVTTAVHSPNWDDPTDAAAPVMVLLHGYGSNERDLPGLAPWLPENLRWISPRAPLPMNTDAAMWFPLGLPGDPDPDDVNVATARLWEWLDAQLPAETPIVPVGFSQGGAMAMELLRSRPERIVAPVLLAGLVAPTQHAADAHLSESRPPVFWGRGDMDGVIPPHAVEGAAGFLAAHTTVTAHVYPGLGHSVDQRVMTDAREFLTQQLAA